jgi:pyrimidine deaminase RibD-like protein
MNAWMLEAVREGRLARCLSFPNPPVGAVLVSGGEIVSKGHTQPPGGDHAEIDCLRKLDSLPADAALYVTLEPCCFFGRTPPCTTAIIEKGIRRVVVGIRDPDPRVSGRGIRFLRSAGIKITEGELDGLIREELAGYLQRCGELPR